MFGHLLSIYFRFKIKQFNPVSFYSKHKKYLKKNMNIALIHLNIKGGQNCENFDVSFIFQPALKKDRKIQKWLEGLLQRQEEG